MAEEIREKEEVVIERDGEPDNGAGNFIGVIIGIALLILALAFILGWFGNDEGTDDTTPIEQETQIEVPAGDTTPDEGTQEPEDEPAPPPNQETPQ